MAKRVADIVVETLQAAGVKHCWGVPGDTLNFVTDAIRRSDIEWVHVRHEEVAGFAAGAEAMLTGDLKGCAGSCGPGSLHFINGLFESHRNRAPVVLIASQIISDEIGFDFPQEVDYGPIYKSCSVFCDEIRTPAQAVRSPVSIASAPAANPATSSCRTCTHSMSLRRIASVTKLSVSPGTPQQCFTPAACNVSTTTSATRLAISVLRDI